MTRGMALLSALTLTGCSACATAPPKRLEPSAPVAPPLSTVGEWPGSEASLALIGLPGSGSGCPVGPTTILTAAHVANQGPLVWSAQGREGTTGVALIDGQLDLARLFTEDQLPAWLAIETHPPVSGEPVAIFGEIANVRAVFITRVLAIDPRSGRLLLDGMAFPGSSGGCVVSRAGKVYAIVQGGVSWPDFPQVRAVAYAYPIWEAQ